jgi:hypothetical protein
MKIVKQIPLFLLAFLFLLASSNFFLHFLDQPPMSGDAGSYMGLLFTSKYLLVVKILELVLVPLVLIPKTRSLALVLLAPISVNVLLFEILILKQPGAGVLLVLLNAFVIYQYKERYLGIVSTAKA